MLPSILLSTLAASFVAAAPSLNLPPSLAVRSNGSTSSPFVSAAWYPGWSATDTSFSNINWQKYSIISWSFAETTPDPSTLDLSNSGPSYVQDFVQQAHDHGAFASITVGGWTGSQFFSSAVNPQNSSAFVQAVLGLVSKYSFDGVNFDWEYPNKPGVGCNQVSDSDTENFIAFIQALRAQPEAKGLIITAAVSVTPYVGSDGQPMTNLSDFANAVDYIAIMNYDINGQWSKLTGPNAPLDDSCSTVQAGSAIEAVKAWTDTGFPAEKIVLGVPAYGHSFNVSTSNAVDSSGNLVINAPFTPIPATTDLDQCGNPELGSDQIDFSALITQGSLNSDGTPANGIKHQFDNCSQTPFLYDPTKQLMVSYDDPQSYEAKGKFIADNNLLGFYMWDITGDSGDLLVDAMFTGAGVTDECSN